MHVTGAAPLALAVSLSASVPMRFDFGPGPAAPGYTRVQAGDGYQASKGYGFDFGFPVRCFDRGGDALTGDLCASSSSFYFSVALPEGRYRVTVTIGDPAKAASAVVKAESRRLMLEGLSAAAGAGAKASFSVDLRRRTLAAGGQVAAWNGDSLDWDGKLTLEFAGAWPALAALDIEPADTAMQVFLAGNSTVCDWENETETAWGQMFPRWFGPGAVVANFAKSGLTGATFIGERRLTKILERIRPGDRLLIEFGHNDMKGAVPGALAAYKANLGKLADSAKARGAVPIFVSCVARRSFDAQGKAVNTFTTPEGDYIAALKEVAASRKAPVIDLNAMTSRLIEALGPQGSADAYFTNDNTHENDYGAYEFSKCVASALPSIDTALAARLAASVVFDPSHPDPVSAFALPLSPDVSLRKPVSLAPAARPAAPSARPVPVSLFRRRPSDLPADAAGRRPRPKIP